MTQQPGPINPVHPILRWMLWLLTGMTALAAQASTPSDFLPVDEAFTFTPQVQEGALVLQWKIADGYYLYKSRLSASSDAPTSTSEWTFLSSSEEKNDPYFGQQQIFHDELKATVAYQSPVASQILIKYQGCATAGLCYPPQTRKIAVPAFTLTNTQVAPASLPVNNRNENSLAEANTDSPTTSLSTLSNDAGLLAKSLQNLPVWLTLGIFFVLGLGLTFTPCVLPMVPILSSIIVGQKTPTRRSSFALSSSYVLGMSLTYATLGATVGLLGAKANIQAMLQNIWVLSFFSLMFVVLSLSMFGLFELQLPDRIRQPLQNASNQSGGKLFSVGLMGAISALVVSPCVSAPLAGVLLYISTTGNVGLGALTLWVMALGMGIPLILIGVFGNRLLPKSGAWMIRVKEFFGFLLLGVALSLLQRVIPEHVTLLLVAMLLIGFGIWLGVFQPADKGLPMLKKTIGLAGMIWAGLLMVGAATGSGSLFTPLNGLVGSKASANMAQPSVGIDFTRVTELENFLLNRQTTDQRPVLVDVYADWCISCKELEHAVFSDASLAPYQARFQFIKYDISEFSDAQQAFLSKEGIVGPPAVLLYSSPPAAQHRAKLVGEFELQQLKELLNQSS